MSCDHSQLLPLPGWTERTRPSPPRRATALAAVVLVPSPGPSVQFTIDNYNNGDGIGIAAIQRNLTRTLANVLGGNVTGARSCIPSQAVTTACPRPLLPPPVGLC